MTTTDSVVDALDFVAVHQADPPAAALFEGLATEYSARYGGDAKQKHSELLAYPAEEFEPPAGALIVGLSRGVPVAGGAFRRYDSTTAELKREAVALYLSMGYTPLYDQSLDSDEIGRHPFEKLLAGGGCQEDTA